jgi:uncharacterized peroxidase-related enzyme
MSRINVINHDTATGKTKELLDTVQKKIGMTPNLMKTMANSPAVLEAYLNFSSTLGGTLNAKLREQIAVLSAEENGCGYCLSAHTAIGKSAGLNETEILSAREANSTDAKSNAALKFAKAILTKRGAVSDTDLQAVKDAGFGEGEIAEIVANVALNVFTNYFNEVAQTEIDFPKVSLKARAA